MPIPTAVLSILAAGVDTMAQPTYAFAYGPVDVADPAAWIPAAPQVFLEEVGWSAVPGRQVVGKTTNAGVLTFHVYVPKGAGTIDAEMNKVDSDMKRLMFALWPQLSASGMLLHPEYQGTAKNYRLVEAFPGEMRIRYALTWRQSRENPETT